MKSVYTVPDMSCNHCKAAIEGKIATLPGVDTVFADPGSKRLTIEGSITEQELRIALDEIGFSLASGT
jgi:copper chaperone CopZ